MKTKHALKLLSLFIFSCFIIPMCLGQKAKHQSYKSGFMHLAKYDIQSNYKTYKAEYDLGNYLGNKYAKLFQKLTYDNNNADILVKFIAKNPFLVGKKVSNDGSEKSPAFYYTVNYEADYGYVVTDLKTNKELINSINTKGSGITPSFKTMSDLDQFMNNAYAQKLISELLDKEIKEFQYLFNDIKMFVSFSLNTITGEAREYEEINFATDNFIKTLSDSSLNMENLKASMKIWETHLAQANFTEKKSVINEKVADALISNLCAGYLVTENYSKIKELLASYKLRHHGGLFDSLDPYFYLLSGFYYPGVLNHCINYPAEKAECIVFYNDISEMDLNFSNKVSDLTRQK